MKTPHRHAAGAAVLFLTGCSLLQAKPDTTSFFVLTAADASTAGGADATVSIGVGPIQLPDYLDRPQLVSRTLNNELHLESLARWAEPLQNGFIRTLQQDLAERLRGGDVRTFPWIDFKPDLSITVDVQRFERVSPGQVELLARWALRDAGGRIQAGDEIDLRVPTADASPEAEAAALSKAVAGLGAELTRAIRSRLPARMGSSTPGPSTASPPSNP